ncbi:ATP-binding protein [Consotaella salsifontis]|uniref:Anti-sigma regulatory factor (Ser/Thr protein kinase) n=1 Tax=Consotaella salsifontis TaxID=1365950 RepID=A0A1T4M7N6_9HYPH|nr:ATP-binding protein [Consotaella salsifontis]SJZ63023.1 Anti-sigma regulatory factor (Ser/Thr protein kinase) [Consotaella salsifontis]
MILLPIVEPSQVGAARRRAVQEGRRLGLSDANCDRLAIVVTEAGTNLVRHARQGEIILVPHLSHEPLSIHVVALDKGPGLVSVEAALRDGFTTKGEGIGGGLGAIKRLSDFLDIYSDTTGTTVVATISEEPLPRFHDAEIAGLTIAKPGFKVGGDAWAFRREEQAMIVMLMDVLGHGAVAADDAHLGVEAFCGAKGAGLEETAALVSQALAGGRGAAALILEVPHGPGRLRAIGLGNVKGEILAGNDRRGIPSAPGIMGTSPKRLAPTEHDWPAGALLVLSTDGLKSADRGGDPLALYVRSPLAIAATLYHRRRRGTDDCGVVVLRASE